jgi:hypothetical protein
MEASSLTPLERAFTFASAKHDGQVRKFSGKPYVTHPQNVCNILTDVGASHGLTIDEGIIVAAMLHDVLEDTDCTKEEIEQIFGTRVANLVLAVTNDKEAISKVGKTAYLEEKVNAMNSDELLIKLADRLDNVSDAGGDDNNDWLVAYAQQTKRVFFDSFRNEAILGPLHKKILSRIGEIVYRSDPKRAFVFHSNLLNVDKFASSRSYTCSAVIKCCIPETTVSMDDFSPNAFVAGQNSSDMVYYADETPTDFENKDAR